MSKLRTLVTATAFLALVGLSLASTVEVARRGLPQPFDIRTVDLVDWLTTRHMRQQGRSMKRRIAAEIERLTAAGHDWDADLAQLDGERRERFLTNWDNLTALFLRDQMEGFFRQDEDRRNEYLDLQIARIGRWWLPPDEDQPSSSRKRRPGNMKRLLSRWDELFQHYEPHDKRRTQHYMQLVQMRAMERAFTPPGADSNASPPD